jgi:hypothetical protein
VFRLIPLRTVSTRAHHPNFAASFGLERAVDQHESNHARRVGAVAPRRDSCRIGTTMSPALSSTSTSSSTIVISPDSTIA